MKKTLALTLMTLLYGSIARAQAATVVYDYTVVGATAAQVQAWSPTLYVNGTAFPLTHTCTGVSPLVTCTATLPNISTALTPSGNQTFTVSLKDSILGESPQSNPTVRVKPSAPSPPRIQ